MSRRERVKNPGAEHKYYSMVPNLLNHRGLSTYAKSLYLVYVEIGWKNGTSAWSERELAELAGMSRHSLRGARDELLIDQWITVDETGTGQAGSPLVTLSDIWPRNNAFFENRGNGDPASASGSNGSTNGSNMDHSIETSANGSNMDQPGRPVDHSQEPPAGHRPGMVQISPSNGRPVDHSELPLKTGRLKTGDTEDYEDRRAIETSPVRTFDRDRPPPGVLCVRCHKTVPYVGSALHTKTCGSPAPASHGDD
jgi:hypothetical protein